MGTGVNLLLAAFAGAFAAQTVPVARQAPTTTVTFVGCGEISGRSRAELLAMAKSMRGAALPAPIYRITGHSIGMASREEEASAAEARAKQVQQFLMEQGIAEAQLRVESMGAQRAEYGLVRQDAENCRVEITRITTARPFSRR